MEKVRPGREVRKAFQGSSNGFTLIEVLVALALFGIIAITFLGGLTTASRAVLTGDIRTTAESLARTQMEYVKNQPYEEAPVDGEAFYNKIDIDDIRYTMWSVNRAGAPVKCDDGDCIIAVPWNTEAGEAASTDDDLQRIKLVIKHEDRDIFSLEGYKVDR